MRRSPVVLRHSTAVVVMMAILTLSCLQPADTTEPPAAAPSPSKRTAVATLAGGCFWCMEPPFEKLDGVISVVSGYTGGKETDPSYQQVSSGRTGHVEAVEITYDPAVIGYHQLLRVFWMNIDPTDEGGQFADRGAQYRTVIFVHDDDQRRVAEASLQGVGDSGIFAAAVVTGIRTATAFHAAEADHQDYYRKNPTHYDAYRRGSGRAGFLDRTWSSRDLPPTLGFVRPSEETLRQHLSQLQYQVTRQEGTERAFDNLYWDHHGTGIYVDIISGEPLFSSADKFKSGTGWPSFTRPLVARNVVERVDDRLGVRRTEIRSRQADSHLGHLFHDGPAPTGLRYCLNSASLRFVPREKMAALGYGPWLAGLE